LDTSGPQCSETGTASVFLRRGMVTEAKSTKFRRQSKPAKSSPGFPLFPYQNQNR